MTRDHLWPQIRDLPFFRGVLRAVEAKLMSEVPLEPLVLDLGCGDGHFAEVVYEQILDLGVDPSLPAVREAKSRKSYSLLVVADGARLPFPDDSIQTLLSNSVLEHIPPLAEVLQEVGRVVREGGVLAFTVPNPGYREDLSLPKWLNKIGLGHLAERYRDWFMRMSRTYNLFHEGEWKDLLQDAGFVIERSRRYFSSAALRVLEWGHYFSTPSLVPRWLTGEWNWSRNRWNFVLTENWLRRYYDEPFSEEGTYCFYLSRKGSASRLKQAD